MKRLLRVLDKTGDTRISYDLESGENLAEAKAAFAEALKKGSSVFAVKPGSNETTQRLKSFEDLSTSEEAIVVPKIVSG